MPRARKQPPELDPDTTYVAWQGFAADVHGVPINVQAGTPYVGTIRRCKPPGGTGWLTVPLPADQGARFREVYPEGDWQAERYQRRKPPPPLRDEDAVVCIRQVSGALALNQQSVAPGTKLPEDAEVVKKNPDCFVEVVPAGLSRENAVSPDTRSPPAIRSWCTKGTGSTAATSRLNGIRHASSYPGLRAQHSSTRGTPRRSSSR
jgi:hypothetical protein